MRSVHILALIALFLIVIFGGWLPGLVFLGAAVGGLYVIGKLERRGIDGKRKKGIR